VFPLEEVIFLLRDSTLVSELGSNQGRERRNLTWRLDSRFHVVPLEKS